MLEYYILDSETSGLRPAWHELTEISIIRYSDRIQVSRNIKALNPERADEEALRITNKTRADIVNGIHPEEAVKFFNSYLEEDGKSPAHRCIIAHNASFDRRHVHALWDTYKSSFPADMWLDTMALARDFAKKNGIIKPKVNLAATLDMMKIAAVGTSHTAKYDTQNTFNIFDKIVNDNYDYLHLIKAFPHNKVEKTDFSDVDMDF